MRTQSVGAVNFEILRDRVAGVATVPEADIVEAVHWYATRAHLVVEPTGALALAAIRAARDGRVEGVGDLELAPGPTVAIISGGNVDPSALADILRSGGGDPLG